jgi:spermidine/putrescine ABC transporter ATP-binding subunit
VATSVLELHGVLKHYGGNLGVGPIDFAVQQGEFLTLLGPSGCGKTTTLQIVAGLLQPDQGRVLMANRDITGLDPQHRDMGLVFQNYALFPHKTIFDNVAFGLRMRKVPRPEIRRRVDEILGMVGLPGVEERFPDQLSGGQRQRVALARALVIQPKVLLLDEPLSNLDAVLRKRMRIELRDIQQRLGITTIFVTHDQDEAFEMSDRIALLNNGRIEQLGRPEDLYDEPSSRFAAEFIGATNLIAGQVRACNGTAVSVDIGNGLLYDALSTGKAYQPGDSVYLMVRPERVDIATIRPEDQAALSAQVVKRIFSGERMIFTLGVREGLRLISTKPNLPQFRSVGLGDQVWVAPQECWVLPREEP